MSLYKATFFKPLLEKKEQFYVDEDGIVCRKTWLVFTPKTANKVLTVLKKKCTKSAKTCKVKLR